MQHMTFWRNLKLLFPNKNRRHAFPTSPFVDFKFLWYICINKVDLHTVSTSTWRAVFTIHPFIKEPHLTPHCIQHILLLNTVKHSSAKQKSHQSRTGRKSLHSHLLKPISLHTQQPLIKKETSIFPPKKRWKQSFNTEPH